MVLSAYRFPPGVVKILLKEPRQLYAFYNYDEVNIVLTFRTFVNEANKNKQILSTLQNNVDNIYRHVECTMYNVQCTMSTYKFN